MIVLRLSRSADEAASCVRPRLAALPHKHLVLETLRKLLNDQICTRERVNIVQSRSYRESLEKTLTRYTNRAITAAQVIDELMRSWPSPWCGPP